MIDRVLTYAAPLATGLIALLAFIVARSTTGEPPAPARLTDAVRFEASRLEFRPRDAVPIKVRAVNPEYERIKRWISAVGASAALADIDGDGLPNDVCLVDPRYDSVSVLSVPAETPGDPDRYPAFALEVAPKGATWAPMGCMAGDFDEDGATDLLVYYWGRTPVLFLRRAVGAPRADAYAPQPLLAGAGAAKPWFTNAAVQADFDGDGHIDLLFGNYFPDDSAVLDPSAKNSPPMQHSMSRAFNGGGLHLFQWKAATGSGPAYEEISDRIPVKKYSEGWFGPEKQRKGWTLALAAADLDGDLRPEIYVANDFGPDQLLINETQTIGAPRFRSSQGIRGPWTPRSRVVGRDSFKGMGADIGSVTGDGRAALAVSNISGPWALIESHFLFVENDKANWSGATPMRDEGADRGVWLSDWGWDIKFADLTNSGCPAILQAIGFLKGEVERWPELQELAMANDELLKLPGAWPRFDQDRTGRLDDLSGLDQRDRVYLADCPAGQRDAGRYHDVSRHLDLGDLSREEGERPGTVSRGIATADVYGDGKLSVIFARQWMPSVFLRNTSPSTGRAIVLKLRAPGGSGDHPFIGATAEVLLPGDGSPEARRIVSGAVDGGSGHGGRRAPEIHLGLGRWDEPPPFDVRLRWRAKGPSGQVSTLFEQTVTLKPGRYSCVLKPSADPVDCKSETRGRPNG